MCYQGLLPENEKTNTVIIINDLCWFTVHQIFPALAGIIS
jgi:hypothetical protein